MQDRPKLGEILVLAGIIDEMQLAAALGEQRRWGRRLGMTLVKMGMVEEGHLVRALAKQLDLPILRLADKRIPEEVIALVPARVASQHGIMPLFVRREEKGPAQLYLGMEDPSNLEVLDDLSFRTGLEIRPVMVTPTELGAAIDFYYHPRPERLELSISDRAGELVDLPSLHRVPSEAEASATSPPAFEQAAGPPAGTSPDAAGQGAELTLEDEVPAAAQAQEELVRELERAIEETERTRIVAKVLTHLLVEKGLLELREIQDRIAQLRDAAAEDASRQA